MIRKIVLLGMGAVLWSARLHGQTASTGSSFQYATWGAAHGGLIEGKQYGPVIGKPFSAIEVRRSVQTLNDGTLVENSDTSHFYRDAEGRMRAESPTRAEIIDPVSHLHYDLNPKDKSYSTEPIAERVISMSVAVVGGHSSTWFSTNKLHDALSEASRSGTTEDLGTELVNGFNAKHSRVTVTVPVGAIGNNREIKIVNDRWYSDELQALVKSSNNDPRFGVNTYELTNIDQSAPDPALFQPPSGYALTQRNH